MIDSACDEWENSSLRKEESLLKGKIHEGRRVEVDSLSFFAEFRSEFSWKKKNPSVL